MKFHLCSSLNPELLQVNLEFYLFGGLTLPKAKVFISKVEYGVFFNLSKRPTMLKCAFPSLFYTGIIQKTHKWQALEFSGGVCLQL